MIGLIRLHSSLDALHQSKEDRQKEDENRNPKSIPLIPVSTIVPPLAEHFRPALIERLLQYDQSIMPELIRLNLSIIEMQLTDFGQMLVNRWSRGK